jgi:O-antigen/teichoic acid export membrane protein
LFSGANFIANVLLAKLLTPVEYGAFTVAFTTFLFLGTIHGALLTEPMLVFGAGRYRDSVVTYLRTLLWGHAAVSVAFGIILTGAGLLCRALRMESIGNALLCLAVAQPLILLLWLMRRACYIESSPRRAASAGTIYLVLVVVGIVSLNKAGRLSVMSSLAVMACGSAVCALLIWISLTAGQAEVSSGPTVRAVAWVHWDYGRWAAVTAALGFVPWNIYYYVLPVFTGLAATAALKAMVNITLPALQSSSALATLLLPALVRRRGTPAFARVVRFAVIGAAAALISFWAAVGAFHGAVVGEAYGGRYLEASSLLWIVGGLPLAAGLSAVFSTALRAEENPRAVFNATLVAALASITLGIPLAAWGGIRGAATGMMAYSVISTGILWFRSYPSRVARRVR